MLTLALKERNIFEICIKEKSDKIVPRILIRQYSDRIILYMNLLRKFKGRRYLVQCVDVCFRDYCPSSLSLSFSDSYVRLYTKFDVSLMEITWTRRNMAKKILSALLPEIDALF